MNAANAASLLAQPDIDGGLIGGASLKAADFLHHRGRCRLTDHSIFSRSNMNVLMTILQAVQILAAIAMIGLILMQHGKGADAGAAFGGGAGSASLFGATGGANFLSRSTAVLAGVFLASTLGWLISATWRRRRPAPAACSKP
jgi:protein translocase SecG subunit